MQMSTALKTIVERRLRVISLEGALRDPKTNRSYRVQRALFNVANLSTVQKVCILFLLPHVLGHKAEVLPENVREHMLGALAEAQHMIVAVRGCRSYSAPELDLIFNTGYTTLFRHLEAIYEINSAAVFEKRLRRHRARPEKYPAPKRFKRTTSEWDHEHPDSSTDDTDEDRATHGLGYFSHGKVSLSHQHWKEQCIAGGSFDLFDTEGSEAAHKTSMRLTASRVRHVAKVNTTTASMLQYLTLHTVFDTLKILMRVHGRTQRRRSTVAMIHCPLVQHARGADGKVVAMEVQMGPDLASINAQRQFLHPEARVARVEIMDLVCDKFGLPKTRRFYTALANLDWNFGQVCFRVFQGVSYRVFQGVSYRVFQGVSAHPHPAPLASACAYLHADGIGCFRGFRIGCFRGFQFTLTLPPQPS